VQLFAVAISLESPPNPIHSKQLRVSSPDHPLDFAWVAKIEWKIKIDIK
jgi:hypothetical protein